MTKDTSVTVKISKDRKYTDKLKGGFPCYVHAISIKAHPQISGTLEARNEGIISLKDVYTLTSLLHKQTCHSICWKIKGKCWYVISSPLLLKTNVKRSKEHRIKRIL